MSPSPSSRFRNNRTVDEFRAAWGQPVTRKRNRDDISLFHRLTESTGPAVDETTWDDLSMDDVFATIDRTTGLPGRQVLYHQLRTYVTDPALLAERARQQEIFRRDAPLREQIQLLSAPLDRNGAEEMALMVLSELPAPPRRSWLLYLLSAACPACWIGTVLFHPLFAVAILLTIVNAVIYSGHATTISPQFKGLSRISALLGIALSLGKLENLHALPQLTFLSEITPTIHRIREQLGWLVMDRDALPDLTQSLFAYLNMLCLLDIVIYLKSLRTLRKHERTLIDVFEAVGSLDASIAAASYVEGLPYSTVPTFVDERQIEVEGLYHPLISNAVDNPLHLRERSALIAGPNMAGKTAFIRSVGINVILAQTINRCLARQAVLPRATVQSAIRREDMLSEGRSYFFTEVQRMMEFTEAAAEAPRQIFLIDEIFRGTNTIERIAASAAVLHALAKQHLVFATTHDIELQEILSDAFTMYHFTDQIIDGRYGFDYRIRTGPVQSRNAIKLLELRGFPKEITAEASRLVVHLETPPRPDPSLQSE